MLHWPPSGAAGGCAPCEVPTSGHLHSCIVFDTGDGRRGGHFTEYAFCGLPGIDLAALADRSREAEDGFRRLLPANC